MRFYAIMNALRPSLLLSDVSFRRPQCLLISNTQATLPLTGSSELGQEPSSRVWFEIT